MSEIFALYWSFWVTLWSNPFYDEYVYLKRELDIQRKRVNNHEERLLEGGL